MNKNSGWIFLGLMALAGVVIYFALKPKNEPAPYQSPATYQPPVLRQGDTVASYPKIRLKANVTTEEETFYENNEKWHIEWSEDGLPTDITVTRHAKRA